MERELNAVLYPHTVCLDERALKYLLVLYDRLYHLPIDVALNPGHDRISQRFSMADSILDLAYGTRAQAHYSVMYMGDDTGWDDHLRRLMASYDMLEARGVCVVLQEPRISSPHEQHPLTPAVDLDMADTAFVDLCLRRVNPTMHIPDETGPAKVKSGGFMVRPPRYRGPHYFAQLCSERVNTALWFAETDNLVPVAVNELFTAVMKRKLHRLSTDSGAGNTARAEVRKGGYSQLSWELLSEAVPADRIAQRSFAELLDYREKTTEAAARFREYLWKVQASFVNQPWDEGFARELERIIHADLIPELLRLRQAKAEIWRKLFREGVKAVADPKALAPTVLALLAPDFSYIQLIGGAMTTAGLVLKPMARSLVDAQEKDRRRRRHALFLLVDLVGAERA